MTEICENFQNKANKVTTTHQQFCEFFYFINQKIKSLKMTVQQKSTFLQQNSFYQ